jgi:putative hydrolase
MGRLINRNKLDYAIKISSLKKHVPSWDFHIHTNFTDGINTVEEMVNEAINKKLTKLIFTEHTEPWLAKNDDWFNEYCKQINFFKDKFVQDIDIKIGIETPAIDYDMGLDMTETMDEHCEFILGAAHRYPDMGNRKVKDLSSQEAIDFEFNTLMALAKNKKIDSIAHIGATCSKYVEQFPEKLLRTIIKTATKNYIAIEINQHYHKPLPRFIEICTEEKALITLGSNAHKKEDIGKVTAALIELN